MWSPAAPSISWAVMRKRLPDLRTLPSSTWLTPSWRATSLTFGDLPLKPKAVLRATTDKAETLERSVMMSSLIPSLKYSCSGSPHMLAKGRTQMEGLLGPVAVPSDDCADGPPVSSAMLVTTFRQPGASRSPVQPARSAHWMRSKGMGSTASSMRNWTSLWMARAWSASDWTHSDFAASADQMTTTALAAL